MSYGRERISRNGRKGPGGLGYAGTVLRVELPGGTHQPGFVAVRIARPVAETEGHHPRGIGDHNLVAQDDRVEGQQPLGLGLTGVPPRPEARRSVVRCDLLSSTRH